MAVYPAHGMIPWDGALKSYIDETVGEPGPQGDPGVGVPAGGTTDQALVKASATDYDTTWADVATQADIDGKIDKVTTRTATDPVERTEWAGTVATSDPNIEEHYVNGVLTAGLNEWGAVRGWSAPYQDALVRAIRVNGDGAGSGGQPCFHIQDRRGASPVDIYARRWDGALVRNGIVMGDVYVRPVAGDPLPEGLPSGTVIVSPEA